LLQVVLLIAAGKHALLWKELGTEIKYVQSAAILEILHALIGFVRSPIARTLPQVFSRLAIVWLAMDPLYTLADPKV
jgi:very-long-chain (3R)-3-hydroxyacyl-CoA dehydratase